MQKSKCDNGEGVSICGVDVLLRDKAYIPVKEFDGKTLPYKDGEFDAVIFIDVLHHIDNPIDILCEAKRVSKGRIIIKDHLREGLFAYSTLKFMDYVGNAHHGVRLPYNYLSKCEWDDIFKKLDLNVKDMDIKLNLYKFPFSLIFDRKLHFIAELE
jgi:SAM-dependent methyltransferase